MSKREGLLEIRIDAKSAVPAYEQIKQAVKLAILSGRLKDGEQLMTLREMALKLMVNPNTIIKVYGQLENEGFIYSRSGAGYYVRVDPAKVRQSSRALFREVTERYISIALQLGYSAEQMLREVAALTSVGIPTAGRKDQKNDRNSGAVL
jgi:DNA-binding transcriptional regulator YhcF (GntR family)